MGDQQQYRQIVKATSLFGGVQVITIIIAIIRSKAIAVLLGPSGMGVASLLQSTIGLVGQFTSMGLSTSAIKDIAQAHNSNNEEAVGKIVAVLRKWVWLTGTLGFVVTLALAPWLSEAAFGNRSYTVAFMLIAVTLLLGQVSAGQGVVLRALRKLKYLATSSVLGAALGLLTSLPLYYYLGMEGIVPAILITSVTGLILTWYFASRIKVKKVTIATHEVWEKGKSMVQLGFMLSLNGIITTGSAYALRIFISRHGSIDDVGLFNAAFAIVNTYVGLVFTAMTTDYYPRLAAVANQPEQWNKVISQQAELAFLILAPILALFIVAAPLGVRLLYSNEFLVITPLLIWGSMGILFKAASWAIAYIFLAKGDSRAFFINELVVNAYMLALNIMGYYMLGLTGLGISYAISYFLYALQVVWVAQRLYGLVLNPNAVKLFARCLILLLSCFIIARNLHGMWFYIFSSLSILFIITFSLRQLHKRIDLFALWKKILNRN
ncbi:MAG: O-antigen translocase [Cyclobacteriaceae bacterium]|nr:MAG: O-antigen translocase [Cyclobacteriaceae bacterium]